MVGLRRWTVVVVVATGAAACADRSTAEGGGSGSDSGSSSSSSADESSSSGDVPEPTMLLHAVQLAIGVEHSCARLDDGTVACWGSGAVGELGDGESGSMHDRWLPERVPGLEGVVELAASWRNTCARLDDGTVRCWGDNGLGQLGNGDSGQGVHSATPVVVSELDDAIDIGVGPSNACAVRQSGDVVCWGVDDADKLGFAAPECGPFVVMRDVPMEYTTPCQATPMAVPGLQGAVEVIVGANTVCARAGDGTVACIGANNTVGQLGNGTTDPPAMPPVPSAVVGAADVAVVGVADSGGCLLQPDATVACWGGNSYGELGRDLQFDDFATTPTVIDTLAGVDTLVVAGGTVCAIAAGQPSCWGDVNYLFEVAPDPGSAAVGHPSALPQPQDIVELQTTGFHACARFADDTVTCWGPSDRGQLGVRPTDVIEYEFTPVRWNG